MRISLSVARAMFTVLLSMGLLTVAGHAQSYLGGGMAPTAGPQSLPDCTVNPVDPDTLMELEATITPGQSEIEPLPRIATDASEIEPLPRITRVMPGATITPAEAEEMIRAFEPDVTVEH